MSSLPNWGVTGPRVAVIERDSQWFRERVQDSELPAEAIIRDYAIHKA